jgi:hypothetical protein
LHVFQNTEILKVDFLENSRFVRRTPREFRGFQKHQYSRSQICAYEKQKHVESSLAFCMLVVLHTTFFVAEERENNLTFIVLHVRRNPHECMNKVRRLCLARSPQSA